MADIIATHVTPPDPEDPPAPGEGTASISVTRGNLQCVGEGIILEVTNIQNMGLSTGVFDAYNPADHEPFYTWTITGPDGSTWSNVPRLLSGHNNRKKRYGRKIMYMPRVAGSYTFSVNAVNPNTGSSLTGAISTTLSVASIEDTIPQSRRVILYDGSDLTGAPTHDTINRYTTWSAARDRANSLSASGPVWLACRGGETFARNSTTNVNFPGVISAYGTGRATIDCSTNNANFCRDGGRNGSLIFIGMAILQDWDMTDHTGTQKRSSDYAFSNNGNGTSFHMTCLTDCEVNGWDANFLYDGGSADNYCICLEDVITGKHINYDVFIGGSSAQMYANGTRFESPGASLAGGMRDDNDNTNASPPYRRNIHGPIRASNATLHLYGCSFHSQNGWSWWGAAWPAHQPDLRFKFGGGIGGDYSVRCCILEGVGITTAASTGSEGPTNMVIEMNHLVSTSQSTEIQVFCTGMTVRNNSLISTSAARDPGNRSDTPVRIQVNKNPDGTSLNGGDPVRIHHNTLIELLGGSAENPIVNVIEAHDNQIVSDNLFGAPNKDTPYWSDGTMTPRTGATLISTGSRFGYWRSGSLTLSADLAPGGSLGPFAWGNDVDGNPVDETTFVGSPGEHVVWMQNKSGQSGRPSNYYFPAVGVGYVNEGVSFTINSSGVTVTNNTTRTWPRFNDDGDLVQYEVQLDRRHDIVARTGSAPAADDGRLWAPDVGTATTPTQKVYADLSGQVRNATTCPGSIAVEVE